MAETPRFAHLAVVVFLGAGFLSAAGLLVAFSAALARAARVARTALAASAAVGCGYLALLLAVAAASSSRTLEPGGRKYFCEVDCHLAYSVERVDYAESLGPEARPLAAEGRFVVLSLRTWFDERTISARRGDGPLTPNPRSVELVDEAGRRYPPSARAAAALGQSSTPLDRPLRPGESYLTVLVFDLPASARNPRVLVADRDPVARLLVDHENSPGHGKIYLPLSPGPLR